MKVLICGGRDPSPEVSKAVQDWVNLNCQPGDTVIHGFAKGVDTVAMRAAQLTPGVKLLSFPADWKTHGKAAGPIRNKKMLVEGQPDVVVAFPGGRGTDNMTTLARKAGTPVCKIVLDDRPKQLLTNWVELAERTLRDHGFALDANRAADFAQGIGETKEYLGEPK